MSWFAPGILLLRSGEDGSSILTAADVADLGFFLPEVVVPVVAMFAGVYALGVAIIGYYHTYVSRVSRASLIAAAVFLSVPGMVLLPAGTALGFVGVDVMLHTLTNDLLLRVVGAVMLAAGLIRNRRRAAAGSGGESDEESHGSSGEESTEHAA